MRRTFTRLALTLAVVFLLFAPPFLPKIATAQPAQGNWVITGTQVVQNKSILLNGNLTVDSGGSLTLIGSILTMNGKKPGQYSIYVAPGGSMYIYNSTITATNPQEGYSFVAMDAHFAMEGTTVHGVGWCLSSLNSCSNEAGNGYWYGNKEYPYGIKLFANNVILTDNRITSNVGGIWISGTNETIDDNKFASDPILPIFMQSVTNSTIESNTLNDTTPFPNPAVQVQGASNFNLFSNNTIACPLQLVGGNAVSCFGLDFTGSWMNTISDNKITAATDVWLQGDSSDNTVAENQLLDFQNALYILASASNRIIDNSIHVEPQSTGGGGMFLTSAHNSTIAGNVVFGGQAGGITVEGTSGSRILNNNFSSSASFSLSLYGSQNNTIAGNHIVNTETGIQLNYLSNANTIFDNEIVANSTLYGICCGFGIKVHDSSGNKVFRNDFFFIQGDQGPYDNGNNTWYSRNGGNYWSSNTGTGGYGIPPDGVDLYPLQSPIRITTVPVPNGPLAPLPANEPIPTLSDMAIVGKNLVLGAGNVQVSKMMVIQNSVVTFGTNGPVGISLGPGATLLIDNSTVYWYRGGIGGSQGSKVIIEDSKLIGGQRSQLRISDFGVGTVLEINESTVTSTPNGYGWVIENRVPAPNSTVVLSGDTFDSFGTASQDTNGPVVLFGISQIDIEDSHFVGCLDGLTGGDPNGAMREGVKFANNTFFDVGITLLWTDTDLYQPGHSYNSTIVATWNNFNSDVDVIGGNLTFRYDNFTAGIEGISGNRVVLAENNIYGNFPVVAQSISASGNYWSSYNGTDSNLDGIGDTPFSNGGVTDSSPYMQPEGWQSQFYLTVDTNVPSLTFTINGSNFATGTGGGGRYRLGYDSRFTIAFPEVLTLSNGTTVAFSHWSDGNTSPTRSMYLSSNSTLAVVYRARSTNSTLSTTNASSTTAATTGSSSSSTGAQGIPVFPFQLVAVTVTVLISVVSYLLVRRKYAR